MTHPPARTLLATAEFVAFDCETTGLDPRTDRIVSLGAVRFRWVGAVSATFDELVDPERAIPPLATSVHGIDDAAVRGRPRLEEMLPSFRAFIGDAVPVAHMGAFDLAFLRRPLRRAGLPAVERVLDVAVLATRFLGPLPDLSLEALGARLGVATSGHHTALGDARTVSALFARMLPELQQRGVRTLADALHWGDLDRPLDLHRRS